MSETAAETKPAETKSPDTKSADNESADNESGNGTPADAEITEAQRQMAATHPSASTVALVILTAIAILGVLYTAADIIVPFVLALVLNLLLSPAKRFLCNRLRLPAALASVLLIFALFSVVGAIATAISLPASNWVSRAPEALPKLQEKIGSLRQPLEYVENGYAKLGHLFEQQGGAEEQNQQKTVAVQQSSGLGGVGLTVLANTRAFVGQLFTIVALLFFLLWAGDTLLRSLVEIMPRFGQKRRVVEIADQVERSISGYLATITMMNAFVGLANGVSAWAFGLPDPLLWGTLAFLLNYIPILGPFVGMVVFFVVGLFTFSVLWWALVPPGVYLLIHILEGETITPMLVANRFTLNPVLVIVSLFFWDWMWGVIGALLAVPLLAICKILCDNIPALTPLGHILGGGRRGGASVT